MMKQLEMKYFVLKPKGCDLAARASRNALRAYANTMRSEGEKEFAYQLIEWVEKEDIAGLDDMENW